MSPLDLLALQVEALFACDAAGRLLHVEDPWGTSPSPRFFLARTVEGNLWRARYDLPADLVTELAAIAASEPVVDDLTRPPTTAGRLCAALGRHGPAAAARLGPAFLIPEGVHWPGDVRAVAEDDTDVITTAFCAPPDPSRLVPCAACFEHGEVVSICFCARRTAHAAEAGVSTRADRRGRGHAPASVAGWAAAVRASGRVPIYSTDWQNAASRRVAAKLGMRLFAEDISFSVTGDGPPQMAGSRVRRTWRA